jgi:hypothetical protein
MARQKAFKSEIHLKRFSAALWIILVCCAPLIAQQTTPVSTTDNIGFVSPNTRENLTLDDATRGMSSKEEMQLAQQAKDLRCVFKRPVSTARAVGSWSDGAEHSLLIRVHSDEDTMRYLMSRLGKTANQKAVIYFHPQRNGKARVYIIRPAKRFRSLAQLSRVLDSTGVAFRTLVPAKQQTLIYVIDVDNSLSGKIRTATRRLRGNVSSRDGNASFIGDDSVREKGQTIFEQEIRNFESKHPNLPPACKNN